jgi:hypothetical protein
MMRFREGNTDGKSPLVEKLFRPMSEKMMQAAEEGIESGELIRVEPSQLMYVAIGPNVFYFLSAPLMQLLTEQDVYDPAALEFRRKAAIELLGQAIFIDRKQGSRVAARILKDTPMPQFDPMHRHYAVKFNNSRSESSREPGRTSNKRAARTSAAEVRYK